MLVLLTEHVLSKPALIVFLRMRINESHNANITWSSSPASSWQIYIAALCTAEGRSQAFLHFPSINTASPHVYLCAHRPVRFCFTLIVSRFTAQYCIRFYTKRRHEYVRTIRFVALGAFLLAQWRIMFHYAS